MVISFDIYICEYNKIALFYIGICLNKICSNHNIAWFIMNINLNCYVNSKQTEFACFCEKTHLAKIKMMTCHLKLNTCIIYLQCQLCYPHTYRFTITHTFTNIYVIKVSTCLKNYIKLQSNQRVTREFVSLFQCWLLAY